MTQSSTTDERARLQLLADYGVLDTAPDPALDEIVALAMQLCDVPVARLSWGRIEGIASGASGAFVVPDARQDPRFASDPLVTGDPSVVFYAGAPLVVEDGLTLGALCVIDCKPRALTEAQRASLATLSRMVVRHLQHRRDASQQAATESRLRAVLTSIGDAVISTDAQGFITFLNPVAEQVTGWRNDEARGQPMAVIFRIINEHTRAKVDSPVERVLREGIIVGLANHTLLIRKDGSEAPIEDSAAPIRNAQGELHGVVLVFRDVTEKKKLEAEREALFAREQAAAAEAQGERAKLESLFAQAPVCIAIVQGPEHVYTFANPAYRALVAGRDVVGQPSSQALPELKGQGFSALLDRVMATGEPYFGKELPIRLAHQSGGPAENDEQLLNFTYTPMRSVSGVRDSVLVTVVDVTEQVLARRRVEQLAAQLQASEEHLRRVVQASGTGVWELDMATGKITSDARHRELMGYEADASLHTSSRVLVMSVEESARVAKAVEAASVQADGGRFLVEYRAGGPDESQRHWIESRGQMFFDEAGKPTRMLGTSVDISARKAAEQALASERFKLERIVQESPAAMVLWRGPELVFELLNQPYQDIFPDRILLGRPLAEALPELDGQPFLDILKRVYETGEAYHATEALVRLSPRQGEPVRDHYMNFSYVRIDGPDGRPYGIYDHVVDVTETVLNRRRLQESEERLRRVLDASGAGTWEMDLATKQVIPDPRYQRLLDLSAPDASERTVLDAIHPEDREGVLQAIAQAAAGENEGRYLATYRLSGPGPVRWVESRGQVIRGEGGRARLVGTSLDMTQRILAVAQMEAALTRVTEVLEAMGDVFFALSAEWRLILQNSNYERQTRTRREDTAGKNFWVLYPDAAAPDSVYWREYHRCMEKRQPVHFEDYYAPLDFWADVRAYPTFDGGIAVFIRDVTAEKHTQEVARKQVEFEQQLIGIVSHDLRNPLNVIQLAAKVLSIKDDLSGTSAKAVLRIQSAAERATRLVRDLLDFTQARLGGGIRIQPGPADLQAVTRSVLSEVEVEYPDRELLARHEGADDIHGEWDADRLSQVVQNLVTNALKYSPPGSPVEVVTRAEDSAVTLVVRNRGNPIPAAQLQTIFEPMQRGANQSDRESRSIGLGLYIVKQVVDAHGGTVSVQSAETEGTTFTVKLPRKLH